MVATAQAGPYAGGGQDASQGAAPTITGAEVSHTADGEILTITGTNFSPHRDNVRVTIGGTQIPVLTAEPKMITASILPNLQGRELEVTIKGWPPVKAAQKIHLPPHVSGISLMSGPPGSVISISGEYFTPPKGGKIEVFIGGVAAPVISNSSSQVSVQIPVGLSAQSPVWGLSVTVRNGKLTSNTDHVVNVQNRVF